MDQEDYIQIRKGPTGKFIVEEFDGETGELIETISEEDSMQDALETMRAITAMEQEDYEDQYDSDF